MDLLVLFDIDGTLTSTVEVDALCLQRALESVLGTRIQSLDAYCGQDGTDTGIVAAAYRAIRKRNPTSVEVVEIQQAFMEELLWHKFEHPSMFHPVSGSRAAFSFCKQQTGWGVGIASGAWRDSAALKLNDIGIDIEKVPCGFADDSPRRTEILRAAMDRAEVHYRTKPWKRVVYVGDGVWDVAATRELGIGFVGIGNGAAKLRLLDAGASTVLDGYADLERFINAIATATTPSAPSEVSA